MSYAEAFARDARVSSSKMAEMRSKSAAPLAAAASLSRGFWPSLPTVDPADLWQQIAPHALAASSEAPSEEAAESSTEDQDTTQAAETVTEDHSIPSVTSRKKKKKPQVLLSSGNLRFKLN